MADKNVKQALGYAVKMKDNGDGSLTPYSHPTALPGLSIPTHDYVSMSYTGDNLTGVVYKTGGAAGTTVATLTLAYTGANLTSVTKS